MSKKHDFLQQTFIEGTPQMKDIGATVTHAERHRGSLMMPPREDWLGDRARGLMHPGATTVLADSCCGLAVGTSLDTAITFATLDLRMDYLRPATPTKALHCNAHCYRMTRSVAFVRAEAYQDDPQEPVATAQATFMLSTPSGGRPLLTRDELRSGSALAEAEAAAAAALSRAVQARPHANDDERSWQPPAASEPARPAGEIPYLDYLGMRVAPDPQTPIFRLPFAPKLVGNPFIPALHGGVVAGFAETAAIMHLNQTLGGRKLPKGIDFSIDYLRSARAEETFASCEVVRRGNRVALVHVRLWQREPDRPVATARAHCLLAEREQA